MPITIVLTAVPAKYVRDPGARSPTLVIKSFGKKYGLTILFISDLDDLKRSVSRFSEQINIRFPDHSFSVTVRVRGGDAPPDGYHEALMSGTLAQHRFVQTFDDCRHEDCLAEDYFGPCPDIPRARATILKG
jgi:hypothetical protein